MVNFLSKGRLRIVPFGGSETEIFLISLLAKGIDGSSNLPGAILFVGLERSETPAFGQAFRKRLEASRLGSIKIVINNSVNLFISFSELSPSLPEIFLFQYPSKNA